MVERLSEISPELLARMVAHFRAVTEKYAHVKDGAGNFNEELMEVRAIVAELPEPIDPDLIEARLIVKQTLTPDSHARCNCREEIDAGRWDNGQKVRAALSGIKRGRELARATGEQP